MDKRNQTETETLLQQWRTRILNWVLTILALTLIPVIITMYLRDLANPSQWGYIYALTAIGGVLIVVAVFRNIANPSGCCALYCWVLLRGLSICV